MKTRLVVSLVIAGLMCAHVSMASGPQLGGRPAEDWIARLERQERVEGLQIPEVVSRLNLSAGDVVADLGAGAGVFSWPLARAVAPGTLYAVEVDKGYIGHLKQRASEEKLTNVEAVLGEYEDPLLPEKVDLAFFHDVLHHVEKRAEYLQKVASYLKPSGRIAVIELDATKPGSSHSDEPELQVMKEDLDTWMTAAGLQKAEEIDLFEDKWFVIYEKGPATR